MLNEKKIIKLYNKHLGRCDSYRMDSHTTSFAKCRILELVKDLKKEEREDIVVVYGDFPELDEKEDGE